MNKILLLLFYCLLISVASQAQINTDSLLPPQDTVTKVVQDTVVKKQTPARDTTVKKRAIVRKTDTVTAGSTAVSPPLKDTIPVLVISAATVTTWKGFMNVLRGHPYYNFFGRPIRMQVQEIQLPDKDTLFYFLVGMLVYCGLIRLFFWKYLDNIMTLFFRVSMRHQQLRDQVLQTPLPSLLLNILFFVSGGMFFTFVAAHYQMVPAISPWLLLVYSMGLLMAIYLGKFILLKIAGWVFNVKHAVDTYVFIVFLVNKMIGIFLLPFLVLMAFPYAALYPVVQTLAFTMLVIFILYRFIISYKPIRNEIKVNRLHFFIYLCAFEIAPLLLIYKVLLIFVERTY